MEIESTKAKIERDQMPPDFEVILDDEHVRKAFAVLLSSVDVEDVFGEFIVPATPASSKAKDPR